MRFQIRNKEGNPIAINTLDEEAAAFWGKKVNPTHYAAPGNQNNWFDCIGFYATMADKGRVHWDKCAGLITGHVLLEMGKENSELARHVELTKKKGSITQVENMVKTELAEHICYSLYYHLPYMQLINHWKNKGYTLYHVE